MTKKQISILLLAAAMLAASITGCGKEKTLSSTGDNIVPKASAQTDGQQEENTQDATTSPDANYEVQLDERNEDAKYQYGMDDLSLIDTVSGKSISIGMTEEEVEAIAGAPVTTDRNYRVYEGVVVSYTEDLKVNALIVSSGQFPDTNQAVRYKSSRGVGLNTSFDDFVKAYGDQYNQRTEGSTEDGTPSETPASAIRYFKLDGKKVEYLGTSLTDDMKKDGTENIYMQDFMFNKDSNQVTTMRVSALDAVGR